jgi:hypothetical protein
MVVEFDDHLIDSTDMVVSCWTKLIVSYTFTTERYLDVPLKSVSKDPKSLNSPIFGIPTIPSRGLVPRVLMLKLSSDLT